MLTQVQVRAYPTGSNLYWIECSLCGPIFCCTPETLEADSVHHLNQHGACILIHPDPGDIP